MNKDVRQLVRKAESQGWELVRRGSHYAMRKGKQHIFFSGTPVEPRAVLNFRALLRRAGVQV